MSISVLFEVTVKDANVANAIANKVKYLNMKVMPYSIEEIGKDAFDANHIMCESLFPEAEVLGLTLAQKSSLESMEGVKKVNIVHHSKIEEKRKWYDHFTIPLLISAVVNLLAVLSVVLGMHADFNLRLDLTDYILYLGLPPVITFLSGIGYIRYRHIS